MKRVSRSLSVLILLALGSMAMLLPAAYTPTNQAVAQTGPNPIVLENQNPGTADWQLFQSGFTASDDATGQILGYASATSVNKGEQIALHISVNPAQTYRIDFYRMGYYGGLGGRLMETVTGLSAVKQPDCPIDANTGLVECQWAKAYTLTVPSTWTTGVYVAKLTNQQNFQSHITFVVRDDSRIADFLYQQPVLTYAAYNNYPAGTTRGKSLYAYNSSGPSTLRGDAAAVKVSLDRPGLAEFSRGYNGDDFSFENYLVSFLEQVGYDVSYSTNLDTHLNGARLLNYKAFFSAGHDEYWTKEMRDNAEVARDAGVNMAFWGANNVYWQVRLEPSSSGTANRVVVGYKERANLDPNPNFALKTDLFRNLGRPEQTLIGVQYTTDNAALATQPFIVQNSASSFYAGSGLTDGAQVPNMIGYEVDKLFSEYAQPLSTTYTILGTSPFTSSAGVPTVSQAVIWRHTSGSWVFGSGTMSWSWALGRDGNQNAGIRQLTQNILAQLLIRTVAPTPTPGPSPTPTSIPPELCAFPAVSVQDNFNRPDNTTLAGIWFGGIGNYTVTGNQLNVAVASDAIMAYNPLYGANQEAYVKISAYNASSSAIRLALKVQDGSFGNPHILAAYLPSQNRIQLLTFDPAVGYLERGSFAVTLQPGDVLGVRALSTGSVDVYRNGAKVITANITGWVNNAVGGFTGLWMSNAANTLLDDYGAGDVACSGAPTPTPTPIPVPPELCAFPAAVLQDNFNRADGTSLAGPWFGGVTNYAVSGNQLRVIPTTDALMAWGTLYGPNQEAYVKISAYSASSTAIRLALKVQDGSFGNPHILAAYLPSQNRIQLLTYDPAVGYLERGSFAVTLQPSDVLGVRALASGIVNVYRNGAQVLTANITGWVNNAVGGFTGLWMSNAANTLLDDYGAGDVVCNSVPTPGPTATNTPTQTPTQTPTAALDATVCSVVTSRYTGNDNGYTLNGSQMSGTTRQKLLSLANFGPAGTVRKTLRIVDGFATSGSITASSLAQCQVFFMGGFPVGTFTTAEITALKTWSTNGGRVLLGCSSSVGSFTYTSDVCARWGYAMASGNSNPNVPTNPTGTNHPIFNGPFGIVSSFNQGGTAQASFSTLPASGSTLLARDSQSRATVVIDTATNDVLLSDVDMITTLGGISSGSGIGNSNDRLAVNLFAFLTTNTTPVPTATPTPTAPPATTATPTPLPTATLVRTATSTATVTRTPLPGPQVTSFTLINADTDQPVPGYDPIPNNATINLTALGVPRINVRANVSGPVVSVRFGLNSNTNYQIENIAPYALESDDGSGNYVGVSPAAGTYDLSGTAFNAANATGTAGATTTVRYVITYAIVTATPAPPTATPATTATAAPSIRTFSNDTKVKIPGSGSSGPASPYPSSITVSGMSGTINKVTVKLKDLSHNSTSDMDYVLVGPAGQKLLLMSDVGDGFKIKDLTLTFADDAAASLPRNTAVQSGTYKPTNYDIGAIDNFPAPAPSGPNSSTLSVFNGTNANGTWRLYVYDDTNGDSGDLNQGWEVTITTQATGPLGAQVDNSVAAAPGQVEVEAIEIGESLPVPLKVGDELKMHYVYLPLLQK